MRKVAIVTGASRGIGRVITEKLLKENFVVVGVFEKNEKEASKFARQRKNLEMIKADIAFEKNVKKVSTHCLGALHME